MRPLILLSCLSLPAFAAPDLAAARQQMVEDLASMKFSKLGNPVLRWDHIPPVYAPEEQPHKLLVVLVEFADRGFDRFAKAPDQGAKLAAHYQAQLFDPSYAKPDTLSHYYKRQSLDTYHLQGHVLPPVKLSGKRAKYGAPHRPEGGEWRNDTDPQGLVEEALKLAGEQDLDWASFDRWDPLDFDGDGLLAEPDGYLDHLVLVYAGGGQSSCQGLYKLGQKLNPNVGPEVLKTLGAEETECASRIWPHRFLVQRREGEGPMIEGRRNARGGVPLGSGLWSLDYNMQSEYTEPATFIHEFGHSVGLPDIYARATSNSTGGWEVMSGTASPSPQNMSAWSRLMLGWLRPKVIRPPSAGGRKQQSVYLRTLDDPLDSSAVAHAKQKAGLWRAAMVVLPPKTRELELVKLPRKGGQLALYSGQGNELKRTATLALDLREAKKPKLSFDAWWDIEGGWDFAYFEVSTDEGKSWTRRMPSDRRFMPAKHGHDGKKSTPGFTGLSGDLDGDGKNESKRGCKPKKKVAHGEDKAGKKKNPCLEPTWVRPSMDLSDLVGKQVLVRWRYFTDMAAVNRGLLIDNVKLSGTRPSRSATETRRRWDFEGKLDRAWTLDGFTVSPGRHTLLVPHFYLLEFRDPYTQSEGADYRYDQGLQRASFRFWWDPETKAMRALRVKPRPGVVAWYYDGAFAWSENEPTSNGQGRGFLLAVDSNPNELLLPGYQGWLKGEAGAFDSRYEVMKDAEAQKTLEKAYQETMCYLRSKAYWPRDLALTCPQDKAQIGLLKAEGKPLMFGYQIINELLPGPDRQAYAPAGELVDYRKRDKAITWRLRDRSLRYLHTTDVPFALEPFEGGLEYYMVENGRLVKTHTAAHPATSRFSDGKPGRWANPKLFFGGVKVPDEGFGFELATPKKGAPEGARVKVWFDWAR